MAETVDPLPPPPVASEPTSTTTGLPSNIAAALACFPLIGGFIFFFIEKRDEFVRFYAMQSIVFGIAWVLFSIVSGIIFSIFGAIPGIGGFFVFIWSLVSMLVHLAFLVVFVISVIKALTGERWDIPYIGQIARKQSDTVTP